MVRELTMAINGHIDLAFEYSVSTSAIEAGLKALEDAGMLPPDMELTIYNEDGSVFDIQITNEWEEEEPKGPPDDFHYEGSSI